MRAWIIKLSLAPLLMMLPSLAVIAEQNLTIKDEYTKAKQALDRRDYSMARRILSRLAKQGQVESQTALALMYDKGLGVPQNFKKAVSLFRLAAEQKDPIAQYHLGIKYVNGHGVKESPKEAYIWFAISFNNGNELAADPLRVLNQSLSTVDRQNALKVVVKKMEQLGR
jgi:TPR repeat protein